MNRTRVPALRKNLTPCLALLCGLASAPAIARLAPASPGITPPADDTSMNGSGDFSPSPTSAGNSPAKKPAMMPVLVRFGNAFLHVRRIRNVYEPQIKAAGNDVQRESLRLEAKAAMDAAVRTAGLDNRRYNFLARKVNTDPVTAKGLTNYLGQVDTWYKSHRKHEQPLTSQPRSTDPDVLELPRMKITRPHLTKVLMDAEIKLALRRPMSKNYRDRNLLVCRKMRTATLIPKVWCSTIEQLFHGRPSMFSANFEDVPVVDGEKMVNAWRGFYGSLPVE